MPSTVYPAQVLAAAPVIQVGIVLNWEVTLLHRHWVTKLWSLCLPPTPHHPPKPGDSRALVATSPRTPHPFNSLVSISPAVSCLSLLVLAGPRLEPACPLFVLRGLASLLPDTLGFIRAWGREGSSPAWSQGTVDIQREAGNQSLIMLSLLSSVTWNGHVSGILAPNVAHVIIQHTRP